MSRINGAFRREKRRICLGHQVGVGRVDPAVDAQDGGYAPRVNIQSRTRAIDVIAAARLAAQAGGA